MEMSQIDQTGASAATRPDVAASVLSKGQEALRGLAEDIAGLREILCDVEAIGGPDMAKKLRGLMHDLDTFEPAVTMIGQIKSGKTTLVNAMAGHPDLLPSDVNPWTSVVTSLHLNVPRASDDPRASFRLFDADEWDNLVRNGGRIGELSARAGADKEVEKLRKQIARMHEKTRERLGRKFEMMLGQQHDYGSFDDSLIQRYVCMGDDFDPDQKADGQGQFADITRSADLWLDAAGLPMPLCIRDTPGVNDTFMMREQITIRALRDSKTCVVVLSAHQALSATDMGLIRLISNMKSRQVVVFVNRIDELSDPAAQVPEIRASLIDTLSQGGMQVPDIVFGSAYWATAVLKNEIDGMIAASAEALRGYAVEALGPEAAGMSVAEMVWSLSGMPALYEAIGVRIADGVGLQTIIAARRRAANYVAALRASSQMVSLKGGSGPVQKMPAAEVEGMLQDIHDEMIVDLNARLDEAFKRFGARVDQVHIRFVDRALESLIHHLETKGEKEVWNYSPDGLRMLMRSSYQVLRKNVMSACDSVYKRAGDELTDAYARIFDVEAENFRVEPPVVPETPQPMALARTIALDLKTSWWKSWWGKRRGYRAFSDGFRELIAAETQPIVAELTAHQTEEIRAVAMGRLETFLREQRDVLADMSAKSQVSIEELNGLFGVSQQKEREMLFEMLFEELEIDDPMPGDGRPGEEGDAA
ncbi:dynamin family protein [Jannaschia seohaensis]|uniref:Dynamin family protein n=1 Tax=Jannaschia seohaensis TaxID=475081 RepID=A0A2Y9C374_9RHOB|nr:dynamin family protein [Jannaschia seohaensis]PWJ12501.1 dynamin family protein [Jannaschia seohaensis]SSA50982.1 Dynamin family protein [Jannaschia seohaensis]